MTVSRRSPRLAAVRPRAVIYLRQSTPREESVSLEQQETACRDYCRRSGYDVVHVDQDGITGQTWRKRPGVQRVMRMIDEREADVLVLWKWSRFARRRLDFEVALDRVRGVGGEVEAATEPIDTKTAAGRFQRGVLAEVAAFEAERIGEGWEETHARRRAAGLPAQGGRKYGYRREGEDYVIEEAEADVLRWAYGRVIEGRGATWIAAELNRQGIVNPAGNVWAQGRIYRLLDSGFAAGLLVHEPRDDHNRKTGTRTYHEGRQPPIITREAWETYQLARRAHADRPSRTVEAKYPLTGLVKCGDCGSGMWAARAQGHGPGHNYVCGLWQRTRTVRCVTAVRHRVEAAVLEWLGLYVDRVERAADADRAAQSRLSRVKRTAEDAQRRAQSVEAKLSRLALAFAEGTVPEAGYAAARDELLAQLRAAQAEAETLTLEATRPAPPMGEAATTLVEEWSELPATDRRNLLATMIREVRVHPPEKRGGRSTIEIVPAWSEDAAG